MKILTMKRLTTVLIVFFMLSGSFLTKAQEDENQECNIKYNLFRAEFKGKKYDQAYENWLWTFENCPSLSVNIYKNGLSIVKYKYENAAGTEKDTYGKLLGEIYEKRLEQKFPKDKPADIYSKYALFLDKTGADEATVYNMLQKSYDIKPEDMGIKSMYKYFNGFIERNKDTNIQAIFDMHDDLIEVVDNKVQNDLKVLKKFNEIEEAGGELNSRQVKNRKGYKKRLELYGNMEDDFGSMLEKYATCDRLIPMYKKDCDTKSNDVVWLKRTVSRLYNKGCTDSDFYYKVVEKYVNADPSSDAYVFYAGMLMQKGNETKALEYFKKAVDLETDNFKKAKYQYNIARMMKKKGRFGEARSYAYRALKARPDLGKAYLLIASMYAKSANRCGNGVFGTRMVYQAALVKAKRAKAVDPSLTRAANAHINSYASKAPSTEDVFNEGLQSGSLYKIGCWIGESVRIP